MVRTRSQLPTRHVSGGVAGAVAGRGGLVVPALVVSSGSFGAGMGGAGDSPAGAQQRASPVGGSGAIAGLGRRRRGGLGLRRC